MKGTRTFMFAGPCFRFEYEGARPLHFSCA